MAVLAVDSEKGRLSLGMKDKYFVGSAGDGVEVEEREHQDTSDVEGDDDPAGVLGLLWLGSGDVMVHQRTVLLCMSRGCRSLVMLMICTCLQLFSFEFFLAVFLTRTCRICVL